MSHITLVSAVCMLLAVLFLTIYYTGILYGNVSKLRLLLNANNTYGDVSKALVNTKGKLLVERSLI